MRIKKNYFKLIIILLIILGLFVIIKPNTKREINVIKETKKQSSFAIYKDDGSGNYVMSSDTSFPTKGYLLNLDKTKCFDSDNNEIPSSIVSQSLDGKITLQTTQTSYCDLYFTKDDDVPVVNTFTITGSKENNETLNSGFTHKVNVTYNIGWSATDVVSYCISTNKDNCDGSWVEVSNTTKAETTTPLLENSEGIKKMYAFLKDRANNISVGKEASITLDLNNPTVSKVTYTTKDTSSITVKVEGTDGDTGSGVVKYECKATTQNTWVTQVGDTCTVTGLNDGTEYTIEGRVTDASGRVSAENRTNTATQTTDTSYSCSIGTRVYDATKGSSSGGYICTASASKQGWYDETTYYTCTETSAQYSSKADAEEACGNAKRGTCDSPLVYACFREGGAFYIWGTDRSSVASRCAAAGYHAQCEDGGNGQFVCKLRSESGYDSASGNGLTSREKCESMCTVSNALWEARGLYVCEVGSTELSISSTLKNCERECFSDGVVSREVNRNYYCPSGWNSYSGSGSSLQCYGAATKG